jgi:hypothetical protein
MYKYLKTKFIVFKLRFNVEFDPRHIYLQKSFVISEQASSFGNKQFIFKLNTMLKVLKGTKLLAKVALPKVIVVHYSMLKFFL